MASENHEPGREWLEVISRPTLEAFALAFAPAAVLEAVVAGQPAVGVANIRAFFQATRQMYTRIGFTHEVRSADRTLLEWEGEFEMESVSGATVLTHDASGAIEHIRLYHYPFSQTVAFSRELKLRLAGTDANEPPHH